MKSSEFAKRRDEIMQAMGEQAIAIVPAAPERPRNRDVLHPYRPDSDFYYLTGFPEPEAVAVLAPGRERGAYLLFCRERDPERERWDGERAGLEGACDRYQAEDAFPISDIDEILPGLMENRARVYYSMGNDPAFDQRLLGWLRRLRSQARTGASEIVALDPLVHEMRLFKSRAEIDTMRRAAAISASAHRRAMRSCRAGMYEYQIEGELLHEFMEQGARSSAYPSIVAGGANACVLHYIGNSARLRRGDLLLIDAGCELDCYASDITRTFPVSGRFSREQRALYEVVLEAQRAAIAEVRPGRHWNCAHEAAVRVIVEGLVELGLLEGKVEALIANEAYRKFYMHRTGHWLGMDVHDVGDYRLGGEWRELEPGMVTTVEPGLYVAPGDKDVARKWWGIGIRIEDDVLVTRKGNEVLSAAVPKSVDAVEAEMAEAAQ